MHIILVFTLIIVVIFIRLSPSLKSTRGIETFWLGLIIFIFAALRSKSVGIDLERYVNNFTEIASWSVSDILYNASGYSWSRDPFFWVFMKTLTYLSLNPQIMIVAIAAIVAVSVSALIYRSKSDVLLCFLIFICLRYFSFTFTGLRQALAMSILFFAIKYLEKKKLVPFVVLTIVASSFHASAFIFMIAYPVMLINKIKPIILFSMGILSITFVFTGVIKSVTSMFSIFNNRFDIDSISREGSSGNIIFSIYMFILFFALIKYKKIRNFIINQDLISLSNKEDKVQWNNNITMYYNFFIIGSVFSFISIYIPSFFRIGYFFIIPSMFFVLPKIISYYQKISGFTALKVVVIILLLFQFIVIGPGGGTEEYVFFWE
tara:strand:- start:8403 stop:9530 length:1128 start_codon:yes stop_codon:yes gene_type:complete